MYTATRRDDARRGESPPVAELVERLKGEFADASSSFLQRSRQLDAAE